MIERTKKKSAKADGRVSHKAKIAKARADGIEDALTYARRIVREVIPEEPASSVRKQLLRKLGELQFYEGSR